MTHVSAEELTDELERFVYVPGTWRCAKCSFTLLQSNLNVGSGTVTARDEPGTKCPNDGSPMWRVSWKQYATEEAALSERLFLEKQSLTAERDSALAEVERLTKRDTLLSKAVTAISVTRDKYLDALCKIRISGSDGCNSGERHARCVEIAQAATTTALQEQPK